MQNLHQAPTRYHSASHGDEFLDLVLGSPMAKGTSALTINHVLMVEDEPRLREMWVRAVAEMGFHPTGVSSAEAALRLLEQNSFAYLVLDLNLPGMDGIQFLEIVRRRWPGIQAIILTGFGDLESARKAIHLDVVDFLTKPCSLGDLEAALGRAASRVRERMLDERIEGSEDILREEQEEEIAIASKRTEPIDEHRDSASLDDLERSHILATLEKHGGNRGAAAAELGISLRKLYYRIAQYQKHVR